MNACNDTGLASSARRLRAGSKVKHLGCQDDFPNLRCPKLRILKVMMKYIIIITLHHLLN